jgi:hypothetical protein
MLPSLAWFAGVFLGSPVLAANYYVAQNGSDSNAGTAAAPFRQIRRALAVPGGLQPGDTVYIADGSYLGFTINGLAGTPDAPITLRGTGNGFADTGTNTSGTVVTNTTDRSDNRDVIALFDCEHLVIEGMRINGANRTGIRVQHGRFVTIRRCHISNSGVWGILTGHCPDLRIEDNLCRDSVGEHGIYVGNSADRPLLRRNICHGNSRSGIQINADVNTPDPRGIEIDGIVTGAVIEANLLYNNGGGRPGIAGGGAAINLDGVQDSVIRDNLLYGNIATGIVFYAIDGAEGPRGNLIAHNTVDMPSNGRWALSLQQVSGTNTVRNNILLHRSTSVRGGLMFENAAGVNATVSGHNIVNHLSDDNGNVRRIALADWKGGGSEPTAREPYSRTGTLSTLFVDADARCYLLRADAPALDSALPLAGFVSDYEGTDRGALPDMGCYERAPLALSIHRVGTVPGSGFLLRLRAGFTRFVTLQSSTDLAAWAVLSGQPLARDGTRVAVPVAPTGARAFYRAQWTP